MLLCYLSSVVPLQLMLLIEKFLKGTLLADSPAVRNDSLSLEKFREKLC